MASQAETARLAAIRARVSEASTDWQLASTGTQLTAVVVANTPPAPIAELTVDCGYVDRDFLRYAHEDILFLLGLLRRAADKIRKLTPEDKRQEEQAKASGNFSAECAMKCDDQAFRRFLLEKKAAKDVTDSTRVASHVRYLLKIDSRSEINHSAEARNRWLDLRAEFEAWMKVDA
jgi:hypothetical protein